MCLDIRQTWTLLCKRHDFFANGNDLIDRWRNLMNKITVEILFDFYFGNLLLLQHTCYVLVLGFILKKGCLDMPNEPLKKR